VPIATNAPQQIASLFDNLIGDREHPWRHLDAERSRRLKVDDELEFGRLQHRQVGGLLALEDAVDVAGRSPELVDQNSPIGNQAAAGTTNDETIPDTARSRRGTRMAAAERLDVRFGSLAAEPIRPSVPLCPLLLQ
jgi:hypothetical protein